MVRLKVDVRVWGGARCRQRGDPAPSPSSCRAAMTTWSRPASWPASRVRRKRDAPLQGHPGAGGQTPGTAQGGDPQDAKDHVLKAICLATLGNAVHTVRLARVTMRRTIAACARTSVRPAGGACPGPPLAPLVHSPGLPTEVRVCGLTGARIAATRWSRSTPWKPSTAGATGSGRDAAPLGKARELRPPSAASSGAHQRHDRSAGDG